ncbi:MAG: hypothetical protein LBQ79_01840 [Deltaproteobacteria bacterium]|jgi:uncharacterized membrane protein|nr:hypothetical protein [Deltaproteobacteria bacterium]
MLLKGTVPSGRANPSPVRASAPALLPALAFALALGLTLGHARPAPAQLSAPVQLSDSFEAAFTYPGQTVDPEEKAQLDITVRNTGLRGDTFLLEVTESPEGWNCEVARFSTVLKGIFLPNEENASLTLSAFPPGDEDAPIPEGEYPFTVRVTSQRTGNSVESSTVLTVSSKKTSSEVLTMTTSYPEIGGPSDGRFAFSLEIKNSGPDEARVNLAAEVPQGWEHSFKPGYEDKQISSIQVPRGQTRTVNLDLNPAYQSDAGSYPVKVIAETPLGSAETQLTVNLTGTFKIRAGAMNDLLSTATEVGVPVTVSLYVINEGSAPQREVSFMAVKPDNWEITFNPERLQDLPPRSRPVPVEMTITPASSALVGDYGVGLSVEGEKTQTALDFRVTVKAGSAWAWIGAVIIILVVAALAYTFRRLGRR